MSWESKANFQIPAVTWEQCHQDLEQKKFIGNYGNSHSVYHALASVRTGVDVANFQSKRSVDEFYISQVEKLLKDKRTQENWKSIVSVDPLGMFASRPTQSACYARMMIPELAHLEADDVIVNSDDRSINVIKMAVDYVWNLKGIAHRLNMEEKAMRQSLSDMTQNPKLLDESLNTYLPPVGGATVYFIGDPSKLADPNTEVAVRCHDECNGSDVFGTDICSCRPYLTYAIQGCVETAKRGGVGVIVYFRKEGRALGECVKFRVYNARKGQPGGDKPENYFKCTESIAGIRDARFQELMPDLLLLLGIKRIDWLLSMSSDKYDAIIASGIEVMQRVSLPDNEIPKGAAVEIAAKIAAGYHTEKIESESLVEKLRSLEHIREQAGRIYALAQQNKSKYFALDENKLDKVVSFVVETIEQQYKSVKDIPYHSRLRHFPEDSITKLMATWTENGCDELEKTRRLIDLIFVSVLVDAGAGDKWHYIDSTEKRWSRSEGLAVATLDMFAEGLFSSDPCQPHRVNSFALKNLTVKSLGKGFQITEHNPMVGFENRLTLLRSLGDALQSKENHRFFGKEIFRPGNIVDYLLAHAKVVEQKEEHKSSSTQPIRRVSLRVLWAAIIEGLESVWPAGLSGVRRGDVWTYSPLKKMGAPGSDMVPFHKLSQWLCYSLLEPFEMMNIQFTDMDLQTGLAEYRNGGLFVDFEVLTPKKEEVFKLQFDVGSELVVEWRALTLMLLDKVAEKIRAHYKLSQEEFPLAKVLQGGTWMAGRRIAAAKRADRSSPIHVRLDGTVF